jgi:hypothetical protein
MGSRSMTVGRYEEIRRRLDEGRGGHETFMREPRSVRHSPKRPRPNASPRGSPRNRPACRNSKRNASPAGRRQADP